MGHPMVPVKGGYKPDFNFRYLAEDVPLGLCFTKGVAVLLGVKTPMIDKVILWCQEKLNKVFITASGKMAEGEDMRSTRAPQAFGITTKQQLVAFLGLRARKPR